MTVKISAKAKKIWNGWKILVPAVVILALLLSLGFLTRPTLATTGSGVTAQLISSGTIAKGAEVEIESAVGSGKTDATKLQLYKITITPGGTSGWHEHGGPHMILVASGTLTYVTFNGVKCVTTTYPAGSAIVDPGNTSHLARNNGSVDVVTYVSQLLPDTEPFRIDIPAPAACN